MLRLTECLGSAHRPTGVSSGYCTETVANAIRLIQFSKVGEALARHLPVLNERLAIAQKEQSEMDRQRCQCCQAETLVRKQSDQRKSGS